MTRFFLMLVLVFSIGLAPALAADAPAAKEPPLPEPLVKMRDDGAQMKYLGRDLGYDGWLAVQNGQQQFFYITPDGSVFFLGILFNKNGRAVTFDQLQRLKGKNDPIFDDLANAPSQRTEEPAPAATPSAPVSTPAPGGVVPKSTAPAATDKTSPAEQFLSEVSNAHWFVMGDSKAPVIYSFIDPMCPHCKKLLTSLKSDIDGGKVQIRVVPVGALTPESHPMAANLLAAKNAADLLTRLMAGDTSAVPATGNASTKDVDDNLEILTKWKFSATPISVYRAKDGTVKLLQGWADDPKALIEDLP